MPLPALAHMKLASAMLAAVAGAGPAPVPTAIGAVVAEASIEPVEVALYDENLRVHAVVAIARDGATDPETTKEVTHLFRCRQSGREHPIAQKTLAMLADVAEHYPGKEVEFVSVYRATRSEGWESPHRGARAIDFRVRGVDLRTLRDYLWRTYTDVGIGWYPSEQFIHMDTRPGLHDTAWTFLNGDNHYHPYWAELARNPPKPRQERKPGV